MEKNNFNNKLNSVPQLKEKIILSDKDSFENKFGQSTKGIEKNIGGKKLNAQKQALRFIEMGAEGKRIFEEKFKELSPLFEF